LLEIKGEFPKLHEKLEYQNFTFEVMEMEERRISKIKVVIKRTQQQ
jgi:CBS domain containing-hemolysin-like protein